MGGGCMDVRNGICAFGVQRAGSVWCMPGAFGEGEARARGRHEEGRSSTVLARGGFMVAGVDSDFDVDATMLRTMREGLSGL